MNKYYRLSLPEREESRGLVQNQSYREIANHLQDYISIEERPAEVAERTIPGHCGKVISSWDLIISQLWALWLNELRV